MTKPKRKTPYFLSKRKLHAGPFPPPFALHGYALKEWERVLSVAPWLRESDASVIADRCVCTARLLEAEEDVQQRGTTVRTRNGRTKNQNVVIARTYRTALQKYDQQLGLTPSGREALRDITLEPIPGSADDPLERALCGDLPPFPPGRSRPPNSN
jgi:P27 family predicted phage terminase small subunit